MNELNVMRIESEANNAIATIDILKQNESWISIITLFAMLSIGIGMQLMNDTPTTEHRYKHLSRVANLDTNLASYTFLIGSADFDLFDFLSLIILATIAMA